MRNSHQPKQIEQGQESHKEGTSRGNGRSTGENFEATMKEEQPPS